MLTAIQLTPLAIFIFTGAPLSIPSCMVSFGTGWSVSLSRLGSLRTAGSRTASAGVRLREDTCTRTQSALLWYDVDVLVVA